MWFENFSILIFSCSCLCVIPHFDFVNLSLIYNDTNHYCAPEYNCGYQGEVKNILCSKTKCKPSFNCGDYFNILRLNEYEQDFLLRLINEFRQHLSYVGFDQNFNEYYIGRNFNDSYNNMKNSAIENVQYDLDKLRNTKKIINMNVVSYDKELEFFAQCSANHCLKGDRLLFQPTTCLRTSQFRNPGQTVFSYTVISSHLQKYNFSNESYLYKAIFSWFNEILNISKDDLKNEPIKMKNFIQMTFPLVKYVGCGRTQFGFNEMLTFTLICFYDLRPKENEPLYVMGSKCAENCVSSYRHPNLKMLKRHLNCTKKFNASLEINPFLNCMSFSHAVIRQRIHKFVKFTDESKEFPCLCGRVRRSDTDIWKPPFGIKVKNIFD